MCSQSGYNQYFTMMSQRTAHGEARQSYRFNPLIFTPVCEKRMNKYVYVGAQLPRSHKSHTHRHAYALCGQAKTLRA